MSSLSKVLKRPRSKSEKTATPPKIVFGDLNTAYESIAQRSTPGTPQQGLWTSVQSPQSDISPSVPLLDHGSSEAVRAAHLSGDLSPPKDSEAHRSKQDFGQAWDPFVSSSTAQDRSSITTLEFKKHVLNEYFETNPGNEEKPTSEVAQEGSEPGKSKLLSSGEYPELGPAQLEAISKLSGVEIQPEEHDALERCGTVQSLSQRHEYGQIESNADIRSLCGAHSNADDVEWSPRSSEEDAPPTAPLPRTPKGKDVIRFPQATELGSESEEVSRSPESYGNTRKLLQLSLPRFPPVTGQRDDFFQDLLKFAREGQSSSSHGTSGKSFAKFSIEEADGPTITRPVSQGEFQHLEQVLSAHMRSRESRADAEASDADLIRIGQISLQFSDGSEADRAPSSQTVSWATNDVDDQLDASEARPSFRTRNGTPPLLFRKLSRSKTELDWETVGDSNELTSSIADYSDTASRSLTKASQLKVPSKVLKHPAHPRYNHSWDLQQDVRSGQYVLTPRYELSTNSLFPHRNAIEPLSLRKDPLAYSHPTPLTAGHSHPFASPPPQISPSRSAGTRVAIQHSNKINTDERHRSSTSLNWLSTAAETISRKFTGGRNSLSATNVPPIPKRSPLRKLKGFHVGTAIEPQPGINLKASSEPGQVHRKMEQTATTENEGIRMAPTSGTDEPSEQVRVNWPLRDPEYAGTKNENQHDEYPSQPPSVSRGRKRPDSDKEDLLNPFHDRHIHQDPTVVAPQFSTAALSAGSGRNTDDTPTSYIANHANNDAFGLQPSEYSTIDGTPPSQARHARSHPRNAGQSRRRRPDDLEANMIEMHEMIPPVPREPGPHPGRPISRPFVPTPHPLHGTMDFRPGSPHLYHLPPRHLWAPVRAEDRIISRRYLVACAFVPPLLLLYKFGYLDRIMRIHSAGKYQGFTPAEKQWAVVILVGWVLLAAMVVPPAVIILNNYGSS
ncbi:MAG: hypothetical protein LQ352_001366 [Teloschistes flavicans]|nr:MAG: hypothetical protein LQ352_001366 [Teloschistes flavicans]